MRLQYIGRDLDIHKSYYEGLTLKANYILSEYILFHSNLGSLFELVHNIDLFSEKFIISAIAKFSDGNEEEKKQFIEETIQMHDKVTYLKKMKNKSKLELIAIQKFNYIIKDYRKKIKDLNLNLLNLYNLADYYDLFDEKILWGNFLLNEYSEKYTEEDNLIEYIHDAIINHDKYFFINPVLQSDCFRIAEINKDFLINNTDTKPDYYSIPLLYLPENINLSIEHIKICRNQILPKVQTLWSRIDDFNKQLQFMQSSKELENTLLNFCNTISTEIENAQGIIDNNIFIQKLINSGNNSSKLCFRMAICTTNTLIDYYEKDKTLLPFVAQSLKELISKTEDLNSYQMVFYLQFNDLNKITK